MKPYRANHLSCAGIAITATLVTLCCPPAMHAWLTGGEKREQNKQKNISPIQST